MKYIVLLFSLVLFTSCQSDRDISERASLPRLQSVSTWERSLTDDVYVGFGNHYCVEGHEYDSGEIVMPMRMTTFDSTGNVDSDISLSIYWPIIDNDILEYEQERRNTTWLYALIEVSWTRYIYDTLSSGQTRLKRMDCYTDFFRFVSFWQEIATLSSREHLVKQRYFYFNHRNDTDRIETYSDLRTTASYSDTIWFLYNEYGNLLGRRILRVYPPWDESACSGRYCQYDTIHYRYESRYGRSPLLMRVDSLDFSNLYAYDNEQRLRKVVWLDMFGLYDGEVNIEWHENKERIERRFDATGALLDETTFNAAGEPQQSLIWQRRTLKTIGDHPVIEYESQNLQGEPVLVREYRYSYN